MSRAAGTPRGASAVRGQPDLSLSSLVGGGGAVEAGSNCHLLFFLLVALCQRLSSAICKHACACFLTPAGGKWAAFDGRRGAGEAGAKSFRFDRGTRGGRGSPESSQENGRDLGKRGGKWAEGVTEWFLPLLLLWNTIESCSLIPISF